MRHELIAVIMTPSVFKSEGPLNYVKYIIMLFRSMGLEAAVYITHRAPNIF